MARLNGPAASSLATPSRTLRGRPGTARGQPTDGRRAAGAPGANSRRRSGAWAEWAVWGG